MNKRGTPPLAFGDCHQKSNQHTVQTGHRHAEFKYAVICSLIWMDYHTIQAVNFTARIIV